MAGSRSLGSLTLDIALRTGAFDTAIDKTARTTKDKAGAISSDLTKIGLGVAAAGAAAATAAVVWTKGMAQMGADVSRLAEVSGVSAERFQELSYAAKSVGIEQDKLGDIFKDVQDKVGDFMQTGAGPLADFFEKIGPKVGVTAKQFKGLSGPDALGLYVSSLEQAGVSQAEMTFYMEAIASDATLLVPLLKNNAQGFKELGAEAQRFGAILNDDAIKAGKDLQRNLQQLDAMWNSVSVTLANKVLPVLSTFAESTIKAWQETDTLKSATDSIAGDNAVPEWLETVSLGLAGVADFAAAVGRTFVSMAAGVQVSLATARAGKSLWDRLNEPGGTAALFTGEETQSQKEYKQNVEGISAALDVFKQKTLAIGGEELTKNLDRMRDSIAGVRGAAIGPPVPASASAGGRGAGIGTGTKPISSTSTDAFLAGIRAQIAEQDALTKSLQAYGLQADKINAGDKLMLQLQQQMGLSVADRSGKVTDATLKEGLALASVLSARTRDNEQMQKSLELAASFVEYRKGLSLAEVELGDALTDSAAGWGKTAEAAQIAAAQSKIYRDAEKQIDAVLKAGLPGALQNVANIEATAEAHASVTAALMGRAQAEQGAQQLLDENRKFAADSILDETQRAAAILKIDEDSWRERIKIAGEGTEQQRKLQEQFDIWLRNKTQLPIIEAQRAARQQTIDSWVETIDGVGEVFREGFADMLNGGTNSWEAFTKSLATTFKTTVADAIYKSFVKPLIVNLVANASAMATGDIGIGNSISKAGGGGMLDTASNLSSIGGAALQAYGGFSVGASAASLGAANLVGVVGGDALGALIAANGAWAGVGTAAAGSAAAAGAAAGATAGASAAGAGAAAGAATAGSMAAAAIPYIGWAIAAAAILSSVIGSDKTPAVGGNAFTKITGAGTIAVGDGEAEARFFGDDRGYKGPNAGLTMGMSALGDQIAAAAKLYGGVADGLQIYAQTAQSPDGQGASGGTALYDKNGVQIFGSSFEGKNDELEANISLSIRRALLGGLKASDLAPEFANVFKGYADNLGTLSEEQIASVTAALEAVRSMNTMFDGMTHTFPELTALGWEAREALVGYSGSLDALTANLSTYYGAFYSESERMQAQLENISDAARNVGVTLPGTKDEFRALVESLDLTSEGGQKAYATLIGLSGSFAEWADYAQNAADTAIAAAKASADAQIAEDKRASDEQIANAKAASDRIADILAAAAVAAENRLQLAQQNANGAMSMLSNAISARRDEIKTAFDLVAKSLQTGIDAAQASVTKLQGLSSRLQSTLDGMAQSLNPESSRSSAQAQIAAALEAARLTGVLPAAADLEGALSVVSGPSEDLFATFEEYQLDFLKTANDIAALGALTDAQISVEERSLTALRDQLELAKRTYDDEMAYYDTMLSTAQAQLDAAMGTTSAVLSVSEALKSLNAAIGSLAAANIGKPSSPAAGGGAPAGLSGTEQAIWDAYAGSGIGYLDSEGWGFWNDAVKNGVPIQEVIDTIVDINNGKSGVNGSHAAGLGYVPFDGYIAELHRGETVLTSDEARAYRALQNAPDMTAPGMRMAGGLEAIRQELVGLRSESLSTAQSNIRIQRLLDRWDGDGLPASREEVAA